MGRVRVDGMKAPIPPYFELFKVGGRAGRAWGRGMVVDQ
jgi:hypothetical protein